MMKKTILAFVLLASFGAASFAGDLGDILGVDMAMGIAGGVAMGVAFSTPSYMDGGSTADSRVFLVGAGWGAIGGAIAGLAYGIYGIIDHVNMRNKSTIKASIDNGDVIVQYNPAISGIELTKKF
jgi:hypothetical protein